MALTRNKNLAKNTKSTQNPAADGASPESDDLAKNPGQGQARRGRAARKGNNVDAAGADKPNARRRKNKPTDGSDPFADVTRKQLKTALGEDSDIRARDMMRAIRNAETPEEALAAMASKAAEQGERIAMTKIVPPTVSRARVRFRHFLTLLSFVVCVLAPTGAAYWYMTERATPQYASVTAFSVRKEETGSPTEIFSAFGLSGTSTNDTDILYDFLTSQEVVNSIRSYRDLEGIWAGPGTDWETGDPVFAMPKGGGIEDQTTYWNRMVDVAYDTAASILEVKVLAFDPSNAQMIARDILNESTKIINTLSSVASADVLRYAQEDLGSAETELRAAREELTRFRNRYQIASIASDIALTTGPLNALTQQLVEAKIEYGLLVRDTTDTDPRILRMNARLEVIEEQIAAERAKLGASVGGDEGSVLSNRIAEFERLNIDLEFAQTSYQTALVSFHAAKADANRQSLYLAAHKNPTLAERADYPKKPTILGLIGGLSFAVWALLALTLLSLRDRR